MKGIIVNFENEEEALEMRKKRPTSKTNLKVGPSFFFLFGLHDVPFKKKNIIYV